MANTTTKKNIKEKKTSEDKAKDQKITHPVIKGVRITEKSSLSADKGRYTFNVSLDATKNEIKKAINLLYKVTPVKITITKIAPKTVVRRGIIGKKSGGKKAVVHLKKGDKIEFV
jgi:large subunit ribosomal protein L23